MDEARGELRFEISPHTADIRSAAHATLANKNNSAIGPFPSRFPRIQLKGNFGSCNARK